MNQQLPITQGHSDQILPLGGSACVLGIKDEQGHLVTVREVTKRDEEHVKPVLEGLRNLGLKIGAFYIDHCQACVNAIGAVFPEAHIQHDYFHILQNIWRKVWREILTYRRDLKAHSESGESHWSSQ